MSEPASRDPRRYSGLLKQVETLLDGVPSHDDLDETICLLVEKAAAGLRDELGLPGGRFYKQVGDLFYLQTTFGAAEHIEDPPPLSVDYPPVEVACAEGLVYFDSEDPLLDRDVEDRLGAREFAAIEVGDEDFLLAFDLEPGLDRDDVLVSLGILRHGINERIRLERVEDVFREARRIQASILPRRMPEYGNFDVAGRTESVDRVGGDFYDFIPISRKILGVAMADVTGHGLPAALQVRDIYMGLRMGLGRDYKIVRTVERLSQIIHRSTLTSRFVSMFYGELELNGNLLYVNAGHPPPFHLSADDEVTPLEEGGVVMGPLPHATYERGYVSLKPGDLVVLYTDGIVEAHRGGDHEEEFGRSRLLAAVRRLREEPAEEIVAGVFDDVASFGGESAPSDDRTLVVVKYPAL